MNNPERIAQRLAGLAADTPRQGTKSSHRSADRLRGVVRCALHWRAYRRCRRMGSRLRRLENEEV